MGSPSVLDRRIVYRSQSGNVGFRGQYFLRAIVFTEAQDGRHANRRCNGVWLPGSRPLAIRRRRVRCPWPRAFHRRETEEAKVNLRCDGTLLLRQ